jgi:hypothetical protein
MKTRVKSVGLLKLSRDITQEKKKKNPNNLETVCRDYCLRNGFRKISKVQKLEKEIQSPFKPNASS